MARFAFFTLAQIVLSASSRWLAAYEFTLFASKSPCVDQLNAEMGAPPSWKRQRRGWHGQLPCRAPLDLVKRLAGHGLMGRYGAELPASKRSFGGTKCVMPALPFYSWVCEW
ncbi:unknown [Eggerthella sp. CAG:209]|nr:unknown [Eggerthella sp. CAG:209]